MAWTRGAVWGEVSGSLGDLGTFLPLLVGRLNPPSLVSALQLQGKALTRIGLAKVNGVSLGTTLVVTGLYNIITGVAFGIPMPVQPMKSVAAIALSEDPLTVPQIMAAGMLVSAAVLVLGATNLIEVFNRLVPKEVIRGMQLGLGLLLAGKGINMVRYEGGDPAHARPVGGADGLGVGIAAALFVALAAFPRRGEEEGAGGLLGGGGCCSAVPGGGGPVEAAPSPGGAVPDAWEEGGQAESPGGSRSEGGSGEPASPAGGVTVACGGGGGEDIDGSDGEGTVLYGRADRFMPTPDPGGGGGGGGGRRGGVPAALVLLVGGLVAGVAGDPSVLDLLRLGPQAPTLVVPTLEDWKVGFWRAAVPQLPLTALNSVVSVCDLSEELFPERAAGPRAVAMSVGAMNLAGCWVGVMPCCHGAGGLAAQYRFGARTGAAVVILGGGKLALGALLGGSSLPLLESFPGVVLGVMLAASGLELASASRAQLAPGAGAGLGAAQGMLVTLLTAAATVASRSTAVGFAAGAALAAALLLREVDCVGALASLVVAREGRGGGARYSYTELGQGGGSAAAVTHDTAC